MSFLEYSKKSFSQTLARHLWFWNSKNQTYWDRGTRINFTYGVGNATVVGFDLWQKVSIHRAFDSIHLTKDHTLSCVMGLSAARFIKSDNVMYEAATAAMKF